MYLFSIGARPKFTKRNSMDSVELWKYSADKVIFLSCIQYVTSRRNMLGKVIPCHSPKVISPILTVFLSQQNGEDQDSESIPRRTKSQLSQPGKRKGYPDSQSSDERPWLDSPVDTNDITVQVPPPLPVSSFTFLLASCSDPIMFLMWCQATGFLFLVLMLS